MEFAADGVGRSVAVGDEAEERISLNLEPGRVYDVSIVLRTMINTWEL